MSARLDLGQIGSAEDILHYLEECIIDDGLSPEELTYWFDSVEEAVKMANKEFQRKYGGY